MNSQVLIGTSGYSYEDWRGRFYPDRIKRKDMLTYYAGEFPFTEINSTYYTLPSPKAFESLAERTPPDFIFTVKACKTLTHERRGDIKSNAQKFLNVLNPILECGKLGAVLLQFPYSFKNTMENRAYLCNIRELMRNVPLAVEFRHSSWDIMPVDEFLKTMQIARVSVDLPGLKNLPVPAVSVTAPIAYVRFHGRNAATWWNHEKSYERYDYLYSEEELREWVPRVRRAWAEAKVTFIAFNNHFNSHAIINARMFKTLLQEPENRKHSGF